MPRKGSGHTAVTISEGILKQAHDYMDKVNREAGYKKIRSDTQLMEEAVINLVVHEIKKEAEDPEELLHKVVQVMLERDDLLKIVFKQFLEMAPEEAHFKLTRMLNKKEIQSLKKLLEGGT
jgi:hypothetical protein